MIYYKITHTKKIIGTVVIYYNRTHKKKRFKITKTDNPHPTFVLYRVHVAVYGI